MEHCDILIVGAGPAGSSLAWASGKNGYDVIVMDKQTFPRNKVCAGWVTPAIIKSLQIDINDYCKGRVFQPITGFRIGRIGRYETETCLDDHPISYGIRRCEFDHYLLERSGARLKLGEPFRNMVRTDKSWIVNDAIQSPIVVGAGGHYCPVARFIGNKSGHSEPVVVAQEIEFRMTPAQSENCKVSPDIPELYFCEDFKGYGWIFRKGNFLNIGLGREDKNKLSEHVRAFCEFLRQLKKIPRDISHKFNGHAYLLYQHSPRQVLADGILLIGDSAGLAYSQSGEGIRTAIESGILAAEVIKNARGNYSSKYLDFYLKLITKRFGKRKTTGNISKMLPDNAKQFLARKLLSNPWFTRNIIIDNWFLHTGQQPLLINKTI
ncbi:MAG: NAD(P)/FAD-dependent oxidoreductase [Gammaproteobacteria bacterium]|nr:NAD(P)/FAD-dependent oxidoreductase [Gammaproteobacteria bacterium]